MAPRAKQRPAAAVQAAPQPEAHPAADRWRDAGALYLTRAREATVVTTPAPEPAPVADPAAVEPAPVATPTAPEQSPTPTPTEPPTPTPTPPPAPPVSAPPPPPGTPSAIPPAAPDPEPAPPADDVQVARLRQEAANYRTRLREAEQAADEARAAAEAARGQAAEATRQANIEVAILRAAAARGVIDPDAALALIDRTAITVGDDGAPDGQTVGQAVDALLAAKPYLRPTAPPTGGVPNPPGQAAPVAETPEARRARLFGGGGDLFDPVAAAQRGGGVVWNAPPEQGA